MQATPKSLRLHIALLGEVNSGKSSFLNLLTGQQISITSAVAGTTTDVVEKAQELPLLGPVLWLDTAGLSDQTELAAKRMEKTLQALNKTDVALLICAHPLLTETEKEILQLLEKQKIPVIRIYNKADTYQERTSNGIYVNSLDVKMRDHVLSALTGELLKLCPDDFINQPPLVGDLIPEHSTVVMMIPLDYEAPKGRLIMPQVQAIRDCLDHNQNVIITKGNTYKNVLDNLKTPPSLVVCDSQIVDQMVKETPRNIKCTTFSVLMARFKGDLCKLVHGAAMIRHLQDNDKILIAESCTHHAVQDDIGRVKIPRWLTQKTQKNLQIDYVNGCDFADHLSQYKLVIQCGGCTINRREMLSRMYQCEKAGVAVTNYGICISELKGVLARVIEPFPEACTLYQATKDKP